MSETRAWTKVSTPVLIGLLMLAEMNHAFEQNMIQLALPHLYADFGDPVTVGWSITGYALVAAATAATAGRLGDVLGRKRVLIAALLLGTAGSMIALLWPTLPGIILGRAIQGTTGAILGLAFGIARERLGDRNLATVLSLISGTALIGGPIGQFIAGLLIDGVGWRAIFAFSAGLAALTVILVWILLPASPATGKLRDVDLGSGLIFAAAVAAILLGITLIGKSNAAVVIALVMAGAIALAAFVVLSLRSPHPAVDFRTFKDGRVAVAHTMMLVMAFGVLAFWLVLVVALQSPPDAGFGLGLGAAATAAVMGVASILGGAIASPLSSILTRRFGVPVALGTGSSFVLAGALILLLSPVVSPLLLAVGGGIAIIGSGFLYAAIPILLMTGVPVERTSEAGNVNQVMKSVGLAAGPLMFSAILASQTVTLGDKTLAAPGAYVTGFTVLAAAGLILLVLTGIAARVLRQNKTASTAAAAASDRSAEADHVH
jgi:MFS family permease